MGASPALGIVVNDGLNNSPPVHRFPSMRTKFQVFSAFSEGMWTRVALVTICFVTSGCSNWQAKTEPTIESIRIVVMLILVVFGFLAAKCFTAATVHAV